MYRCPVYLDDKSHDCSLQLYKQHFASEGGDDDEDEGEAVDGEGVTDQLAPSATKKRLVSPLSLLKRYSCVLCREYSCMAAALHESHRLHALKRPPVRSASGLQT